MRDKLTTVAVVVIVAVVAVAIYVAIYLVLNPCGRAISC